MAFEGYDDPNCENYRNIDADFNISKNDCLSGEYKKGNGSGGNPHVEQVPFALGAPGVIFRNRTKPYIVTSSKNREPDDIATGDQGE